MAGKRLREHLLNRDHFTIITELCGGPGYNLAPIKTFLTDARSSQNQDIPADFDWVGITLPQSPGGVANVEPADVLSAIKDWDLQGDLDIIPHVTCKDHNANALKSALIGYQTHGIESILALTGDKPLGARGVFEMESVCLLGLIQQMNNQALLKAKAEQWDDLPRFYSGAAVSPFKYTEALRC